MNIAILGTRGVPNHYGGFEQLAEYLSLGLVERGHQVTVYNSHSHPYQQPQWKGVTIVHQYDPEHKLGTAGQFFYDLNCIRHSRTQRFDIILQLGYTSSSIWSDLFPGHSLVVTNMDGLEWKRSKYGRFTKQFLKIAEKLAVAKSDVLVSDSKGIEKYLQAKYGVPSYYIAYGATLFNEKNPSALQPYGVTPYGYDLLIARLEPENSIETILEGLTRSTSTRPLLVIGGLNTRLGKTLQARFPDKRIKFLGAIYNIDVLNNLRAYSNLYFHGHTVGGTNPSLLEAMASDCLICAHQNDFNGSILEENAYYFQTPEEVKMLLESKTKAGAEFEKIENNRRKIEQSFSWETIISQYEACFLASIASGRKAKT
ncbi:DUF1972 domain-containing protein [Rufibacter psychrotolerans]|uniref:DUF1972 domain-containing protein n=1 Tax=Rufibacter psychrotolerans TaxID=2812556 RepID=UPI001966D6F5|nr:DUF1972 domain-containing protein [Rufibacter sp. SYSU D00308]